jgi:hypothetical protein
MEPIEGPIVPALRYLDLPSAISTRAAGPRTCSYGHLQHGFQALP